MVFIFSMEDIRFELYGYDTPSLRKRCVEENHRVTYDGYDYVWDVCIDGKWERQSIIQYDTFSKAVSHVRFWLAKYNKELTKRNLAKANAQHFNKMRKEAEVLKSLHEISREYNYKTKEKIKQMIELKPDITNEEISDLLDIDKAAISRHRKNINL